MKARLAIAARQIALIGAIAAALGAIAAINELHASRAASVNAVDAYLACVLTAPPHDDCARELARMERSQ